MKKFMTIVIVMMALILPLSAKEQQSGSSSSQTTDIVIDLNLKKPGKIPRAPMKINISAIYDAADNRIDIVYKGESEGEAFLYLNGAVVGYDSELNTSFEVGEPGLYTIEIHTEGWIAYGELQI